MLNQLLPRPPAFKGLRPSYPAYTKVLGPEFAEFAEGLEDGVLFGPAEPNCGDLRYFLHRGESGISTFLKLVPHEHFARQCAADDFARWVSDQGVNACVRRPSYPKFTRSGNVLFAYPYLPARFATTSVSDLRNLAISLAAMHRALALLPDTASIQSDSAKRMDLLERRIKHIDQQSSSPGSYTQRLKAIFHVEDGLSALINGAELHQATHGDLVFGNILFPIEEGMPTILDFEDTQISWMPPGLDLALAIERFILLPVVDDNEALRLGREFLDAYSKTSPEAGEVARFPLHDYLRFLSLRSLATLAELEAIGIPVTIGEWEKFFWLYAHTFARARMLRELIPTGRNC